MRVGSQRIHEGFRKKLRKIIVQKKKMSKTEKDVGWVQKKDGSIDKRFTMPQVLNQDKSRDMRFGLNEPPKFGSWNTLTEGNSKYYNSQPVSRGQFGTYQVGTAKPGRPGPKEQVYVGKDSNLGSRPNDHGRGGDDNISDLMNRAQNQGLNTYVRTAKAANGMEMRAQELYELGTAHFSWNNQDNGGRFHGEHTSDGRQKW